MAADQPALRFAQQQLQHPKDLGRHPGAQRREHGDLPAIGLFQGVRQSRGLLPIRGLRNRQSEPFDISPSAKEALGADAGAAECLGVVDELVPTREVEFTPAVDRSRAKHPTVRFLETPHEVGNT